MAGIDTNQLRSAFVAEVTNGTTPSTPGFLTMHAPAVRNAGPTRSHQGSLVAGGALLGDTLLTNKSGLAIANAPLVYGLYDTLFETLFQGAWSTNVLKDGKAFKTVTVENSTIAGIGGTRTYWRDLGVRATGGTLEMAADDTMKLSLDMMGMTSQAASTSAIAGATYTDPTNNDEFGSAVQLGAVTLAGFTLDGITSLSIDFAFDGVEGQAIAGTTLYGITPGACRVTAKLRCFVDANFKAMYDAARQTGAQTAALFTVNFGSVTAKKYKLEILKCTIDMADLDFSGATAFHDITLTGTYSSSDAAVMQLTRAIA